MLSYVIPTSEDKPNPFRPPDSEVQEAVGSEEKDSSISVSETRKSQNISGNRQDEFIKRELHVSQSEPDSSKCELPSSSGEETRAVQILNGKSAEELIDETRIKVRVDSGSDVAGGVGSVVGDGARSSGDVAISGGLDSDDHVVVPSLKCIKSGRIEEVSEVKSEDLTPESENRSVVSDNLTTPGSEDRSISKYSKPALKR